MPKSRRATYAYRNDAIGLFLRLWFFPLLGPGDDVYVEVRYLLRSIGTTRSAWLWVGQRESWLLGLAAAVGLGDSLVVRSRRSLRANTSGVFRQPADCREFQISLKGMILVLAMLPTVQQAHTAHKRQSTTILTSLFDRIGQLGKQITVPFSVGGQMLQCVLRIEGMGFSTTCADWARFLVEELGLDLGASHVSVFVACLSSRASYYRETAKAILEQMAIWLSVAWQLDYRQTKALGGKRNLLPTIAGPSGRKRRLDPSTVLYVAKQRSISAQKIVFCSDDGDLNISPGAAARCVRLLLDANRKIVFEGLSPMRRLSISMDGTSFRGEDFETVIAYSHRCKCAGVMQPQVGKHVTKHRPTKKTEKQKKTHTNTCVQQRPKTPKDAQIRPKTPKIAQRRPKTPKDAQNRPKTPKIAQNRPTTPTPDRPKTPSSGKKNTKDATNTNKQHNKKYNTRKTTQQSKQKNNSTNKQHD